MRKWETGINGLRGESYRHKTLTFKTRGFKLFHFEKRSKRKDGASYEKSGGF